jgi:5-formyltetrahydrofolate cyclo-ligase
MREVKQKHDEAESRSSSQRICEKLLAHPLVLSAEALIVYHSMPDEPDTHELIKEFVRQGKKVFLPKVAGETTITLHRYFTDKDLAKGAFGIYEPVTPIVPETDIPYIASQRGRVVCVVPGMAFDKYGRRLGRGKGYYDRLLKKLPYVYTIGVAFAYQIIDEIPYNKYDMMMDEVIYS